MSKFRQKPVVIDAIQFTGDNSRDVLEFIGAKLLVGNSDGVYVETIKGQGLARPCDWIIRGVDGEFSLCKPDIFEVTYESVDAQGCRRADTQAESAAMTLGANPRS